MITNGAKELYAYSNGDLFKKTKLVKVPVSKRVSEDFARNASLKGDTTGCGDNFAGGVIASMAMQLQSSAIGKFNLMEAISWGIASGGFTCYYLGGTYIESTEGEKLKILESFKNEYVQQIKAL
jgi:sugar/nucleoside kinase (ribokinase family)